MPFNVVIAPPPVSYSQYKEMTDYCINEVKDRPNELYIIACKCFQQAKNLLETIADPNDEVRAKKRFNFNLTEKRFSNFHSDNIPYKSCEDKYYCS